MKFRYARHTNNLSAIIDFYTKIIGLEILGNFENHNNYNGVFLGKPNLQWHLEFTESADKAIHHPDDDDLIVFYLRSEIEMNIILNSAKQSCVTQVASKNPYWKTNGVELKDPDGYGVIITIDN